jgi:hypothetical protein
MRPLMLGVLGILLAAILAAGCGDDDGGDGGGGGGNGEPKVTKSDEDIEDEIREHMTRRASDVIVGELEINCPGLISENIDRNKPTECTATDEAGNLTEFTVKSKGKQYSYSPGEIVVGLAIGQ